ncbi:MAG: hypothetical protein HY360_02265 [Verrucomicrobia bacterium]|nr:hypothetical protein [Verrucomicrobiota bacterium]
MKSLVPTFIGALFCVSILHAEFLQDPDANTLWIEDGKDIHTSTSDSSKAWLSNLEVSAAPGGGFVLSAEGDKHDRFVRYCPADVEYPYLTWEITEVEMFPGYRDFVLFYGEIGEKTSPAVFQMVSRPQSGIFAVRLPNLQQAKMSLYLALNNARLTFKHLKTVKQPACFIEMQSPSFQGKAALNAGDDLTFRVILEKPAEDVALTFFHGYTMPQLKLNGEQQVQLAPEKGNKKIWRAGIKINTCEGANFQKSDEQFQPGSFLVKACVLGGASDQPLWTANAYVFNLNRKK